jgi:hypothetical protein
MVAALMSLAYCLPCHISDCVGHAAPALLYCSSHAIQVLGFVILHFSPGLFSLQINLTSHFLLFHHEVGMITMAIEEVSIGCSMYARQSNESIICHSQIETNAVAICV